jgi:hypothetical protein
MQARQENFLSMTALRTLAPSVFGEHGSERTSARYMHIPTSKVVEGLMAQGFMPVEARQCYARSDEKKNFTKHMVRFRHIDTKPVTVGGGLFPELVLTNSHDGLSAYKLTAGLYRLVCSNGLIAGDSMQSVNVRHQGNVLDNVIEGSFEIVKQSMKMLESAELMSGIELSRDEQMIFANAAHQIRYDDEPQGQGIAARDFLETRRWSERNSKDLFTTFNVVQENIIKGGVRGYSTDQHGNTRRTTTRAVKAIDTDTKLNKALWTLAEKMAELKKA